jgi:hypothetical protein
MPQCLKEGGVYIVQPPCAQRPLHTTSSASLGGLGINLGLYRKYMRGFFFVEFSLALAQGPSGHPFEDALFRISP